jgi:hypothetical protein
LTSEYPVKYSVLQRRGRKVIREIAKRLKESRKAWFDLVREAIKEGLGYEQIQEALAEEGVSPPSRGYWGQLVRLWSWAISLGIEEEKAASLLSSAGVSKALAISRVSLTKEEAEELLSWASTVTIEEVREEVYRRLGKEGEFTQGFKSIRVPESVYGMFQKARARVSNIPGMPSFSEVQMVEFVSDLLLSLNHEMIRSLWKALYGSGEERFLPDGLS